MSRLHFIGVLATLLFAACSRAPNQEAPKPAAPSSAAMPAMPAMPASLDDWAKGAQLFEGLGSFHRKVTTSSTEAQQYFDQGMRLMWAFNHDEASRSFARAAQLDPKCAM